MKALGDYINESTMRDKWTEGQVQTEIDRLLHDDSSQENINQNIYNLAYFYYVNKSLLTGKKYTKEDVFYVLDILKERGYKYVTDDLCDNDKLRKLALVILFFANPLKNNEVLDLSFIDVSKAKTLDKLFSYNLCGKEKCTYDVSSWNVSNCTSLVGLFRDSNVKIKGLEKWNTSNVKSIQSFAEYFKGVEIPGIEKWNVSGVENMSHAFMNATMFNMDLSKWNVSSVENMGNMFRNCKKFNSDLSKWDVSSVKDMTDMFLNCENFNSDLSKWDVSKVEDIYDMFRNCKKFNADLSKWKLGSKYGAGPDTFKGSGVKKVPDWWESHAVASIKAIR